MNIYPSAPSPYKIINYFFRSFSLQKKNPTASSFFLSYKKNPFFLSRKIEINFFASSFFSLKNEN